MLYSKSLKGIFKYCSFKENQINIRLWQKYFWPEDSGETYLKNSRQDTDQRLISSQPTVTQKILIKYFERVNTQDFCPQEPSLRNPGDKRHITKKRQEGLPGDPAMTMMGKERWRTGAQFHDLTWKTRQDTTAGCRGKSTQGVKSSHRGQHYSKWGTAEKQGRGSKRLAKFSTTLRRKPSEGTKVNIQRY